MEGINEYLPLNKKKKVYIIMKYNIINKEKYLELFSDEFCKKNKKLCKFIINNKEYDLVSKLNLDNYIKINTLKVKLSIINNIISFRKMFNKCKSLISLPKIINVSTNKVKDLSFMFSGCSSLKKLPDISKWNTSNVDNL